MHGDPLFLIYIFHVIDVMNDCAKLRKYFILTCILMALALINNAHPYYSRHLCRNSKLRHARERALRKKSKHIKGSLRYLFLDLNRLDCRSPYLLFHGSDSIPTFYTYTFYTIPTFYTFCKNEKHLDS